MIVCPSCKSEQINGTLFCGECGSELVTSTATAFDVPNNISSASPQPVLRQARVGSTPAGNIVKPSMPPARPAMPSPPAANPPRHNQVSTRPGLRLLVLNTGRVVDCPDEENIIIGRADAVTGDSPGIDLTPDNALELGVSRRHASLTLKDNRVFLTDLGSTNRTFLNRQVMVRGQAYEVHDGDEIRLGNIIIKVIVNSNFNGFMR
ncbi:MAG TPA: FHA domain-containing protein [Chloroflexia bacterium]|nr:FHA domain-containing protein [Chloroflexia bacterium]